jgi:hypothetical protein
VTAPSNFTISGLSLRLRGSFSGARSAKLPFNAPVDFQAALSYAFGVTAGKVNLMHWADYAINAATNQDLNLADGSLLDPDGQPLVFARLKALILFLAPAVAPAVVADHFLLGGNSTTPYYGPLAGTTPSVEIRNGPKGGVFVDACGDAAGWPVDAVNNKILRVRNPAADAGTGTLVLLGCDA